MAGGWSVIIILHFINHQRLTCLLHLLYCFTNSYKSVCIHTTVIHSLQVKKVTVCRAQSVQSGYLHLMLVDLYTLGLQYC